MLTKQYQLLLLVLLLTIFQVMAATTINYFDANPPPEVDDEPTEIWDTGIVLWIKISDCPLKNCSCQVKINETDRSVFVDDYDRPLGILQAVITKLEPYTFYTFILSCDEVVENAVYKNRTAVGYPSPPRNLTYQKNFTNAFYTWLPPLNPGGPDYYYKLTIDPVSIEVHLPSTILSYQLTFADKPYAYYRLSIEACNTDSRNRSQCSLEISTIFYMEYPLTTTSPTSRSVAIVSDAVHISVLVILFLFFRMIQ
ncbi:unnamed protein product [Rotaria sp. Silwood1]|nr:unnamed protein product [Rotaria sp. Silwood1]